MNNTTTETAKRGRPVVANSARQAKLTARAERVANGGEVKRGRPSNPTSARQTKIAAQEARKAAGVEIKVGRPKAVKAETIAA